MVVTQEAAGAVAQAGGVAGATALAVLGHLDMAAVYLIVVSVCTMRAAAVAFGAQSGRERFSMAVAVYNAFYMAALSIMALGTILAIGEDATPGYQLLISGGFGWLGPIALSRIGSAVEKVIDWVFSKLGLASPVSPRSGPTANRTPPALEPEREARDLQETLDEFDRTIDGVPRREDRAPPPGGPVMNPPGSPPRLPFPPFKGD